MQESGSRAVAFPSRMRRQGYKQTVAMLAARIVAQECIRVGCNIVAVRDAGPVDDGGATRRRGVNRLGYGLCAKNTAKALTCHVVSARPCLPAGRDALAEPGVHSVAAMAATDTRFSAVTAASFLHCRHCRQLPPLPSLPSASATAASHFRIGTVAAWILCMPARPTNLRHAGHGDFMHPSVIRPSAALRPLGGGSRRSACPSNPYRRRSGDTGRHADREWRRPA